MSNNTSCGCECDEDLGLPVGATGAAGVPAFHSMSYTVSGSPLATVSTNYIEAGRFVFSNTMATPFTALKTNVWMSAGTGSMRIIDLITSVVIYENTAITSTSAINIETITGQSIYNVVSAIIAVQVKTQNAANTINVASSTFYYS